MNDSTAGRDHGPDSSRSKRDWTSELKNFFGFGMPYEDSEELIAADDRDADAERYRGQHRAPEVSRPSRTDAGSFGGARSLDEQQVQVERITSFENLDVRIGLPFRGGDIVVFRLVDIERVEALRVVAYASGLAYALYGRFEKVGPRAFAIIPKHAVVNTDELRAALDAKSW